MFLKVPGWHHGPPPDLGEPSAEGRGRDAMRVLAVPRRPCLCMWFGSVAQPRGLWLVATKGAVLRCHLFGSIVSFFVPCHIRRP